MPKVPRVSGAEAVRALERLGFGVVRQRGSHIVKNRNLGRRAAPSGCLGWRVYHQALMPILSAQIRDDACSFALRGRLVPSTLGSYARRFDGHCCAAFAHRSCDALAATSDYDVTAIARDARSRQKATMRKAVFLRPRKTQAAPSRASKAASERSVYQTRSF